MSENQKVFGGCLCGKFRYEVTPPATASAICCCESCTKAAGAPAICWTGFKRSDFRVLNGMVEIYQSSPGVNRGFCPHCGTTLTYQMDPSIFQVDTSAIEQPIIGDDMFIATRTLDNPNAFPPDHKPAFYDERVNWFNLEGG